MARCSELDYVGGLRTFLALHDVEADALILLQGAETPVLDGGVVDKEIGAAFIGRDEAETLFRVEPLNATERDGLFEFPEYLTSVLYFTSRKLNSYTARFKRICSICPSTESCPCWDR